MKEEKKSFVFISYSTHNQDIAFEACDYLEAAGIACWIAPRNVVAGANYAGQIVSAIRNCDAFVLIASNAINESGHVSNEVSLAFDAKKDIIPFKIEETEFSDEYLYFLGRKHWIDAHTDIGEGLKLLKSTLLSASNQSVAYSNNMENGLGDKNVIRKQQSENVVFSEETYSVVSPQEFCKYEIALEKVKEQLESIIADFKEEFDTKQSGLKEGLKILDLLGDDWRIILDQEKQVAGYWVFIALNDESFAEAKQGIFDEKDISLENIDFIDLPGEYNGYLWMMGTNPKKWTTELQMLLVQSLIEYIEDNAQRGLFFSSICSLAESRQSISIRTKIGMKIIAEHFNGGKVCFLDMKSIKNNNFFAKHGKLVECYEDYFHSVEEFNPKSVIEDTETEEQELEAGQNETSETRIDNSPLVNDYLQKAYDLYKSSYLAVAESYCDKILEIEDTNYQAWLLKGTISGRTSTLDRPYISKSVDAFIHAIKNVPRNLKETLRAEVGDGMFELGHNFVSIDVDEFIECPDIKHAQQILSDIKIVSSEYKKIEDETGEKFSAAKVLETTGIYLAQVSMKIWKEEVVPKYEGKDKRPDKKKWEEFIEQTDICEFLIAQTTKIVNGATELIEMYRNLITMQEAVINSCAWEQRFQSPSMVWCKSHELSQDENLDRQETIKNYKHALEVCAHASNKE